MSNVYVEKQEKGYVAIQNKEVIAKGKTQASTAGKAQRLKPTDPILAERFRQVNVQDLADLLVAEQRIAR
jgi:hypothetical protein